MKVILEPKVTVVGHTVFTPHPTYQIPDDGTDAERLGAFAAKGCYDSYGASGRANIDNQRAVIESVHGSVLEHSHVSLFIEGITRALSLELNRHRPFNISQRSTRYTKEEESAIVLDPYYAELFKKWYIHFDEDAAKWRCNATAETSRPDSLIEQTLLVDFLNITEQSIFSYKLQVEALIKLNPFSLSGFDLRKWARGKARNVLPHALETRGTWTNNHRGLRWFIELRSERHAEPEIRVLANKIFEAVKDLAPTYYEDFVATEVDGINELKPKYSKV